MYVGMMPYDGMVVQTPEQMGRRRAILTDSERRVLREGEKTNRYYQAVSRVRKKIDEELTEDVDLLAEHHPELLEELRNVVCERKDE